MRTDTCIQRSCICLLMQNSMRNSKAVRSAINDAAASGVQVRQEKHALLLTASVKSACLREAVQNIASAANVEVVQVNENQCRTLLPDTLPFQVLVEVMEDCVHPERRVVRNMAPELNTEDVDEA